MVEQNLSSKLLEQVPKGRGLPPVERWNPPFCGNIDIRIARDGTWYYQGGEIQRQGLVRLFSSILWRQSDDYFLVTPVEKVGIRVDDAAFVAIELKQQGQSKTQQLTFVTQVGDEVTADAEHPLRVVTDPVTGEPSPYVLVRRNLEALIHRNVFYQLVELAESRQIDGEPWLGVWSCGQFFALGRTE